MASPVEPPPGRSRGLLAEFKEFVNKGNLVEIAVAFVLGLAFKTVIDSIAGTPENPGILGGILGAVFGGDAPNFSDRGITVNDSFIPIGGFVTAVINFLLVALTLFVVIKIYNQFKRRQPDGGASQIEVLEEIRDELRNRPLR